MFVGGDVKSDHPNTIGPLTRLKTKSLEIWPSAPLPL